MVFSTVYVTVYFFIYRCRFRKEHTLDYKLAKERASLANPKRKAKEEFKQERAKQSLKLSKVQKKTVQKLSFSNNLWATPGEFLEHLFYGYLPFI